MILEEVLAKGLPQCAAISPGPKGCRLRCLHSPGRLKAVAVYYSASRSLRLLLDIMKNGSEKAKILKCADRISNMISLGYVTDPEFIERYCDETEYFILSMAIQVDFPMYQELINLIITRRRYLEDGGYFDNRTKPTTSADSTK